MLFFFQGSLQLLNKYANSLERGVNLRPGVLAAKSFRFVLQNGTLEQEMSDQRVFKFHF